MFLENQYQVAYVAADLGAAVKTLEEQYGTGAFREIGGKPVKVTTPKGEGDMVVKTAIAQVGGMTIEIIEPVSGMVDIYTDALGPDRPLVFHHLAMKTDDIEAVRAESERLGRPVLLSGEIGPLKFMYVDARDTVGHMLEYVSAPPEMWRR